MEKLFTKRNTIIFIGILTVWRIFLNATLELHPDEAYYWVWTRHLQLSYFDHPPMIAWFIKITTLFSSSEFFVRFSGILVSIILSVLIWALARELFKEEKVAAASAMLLNVYPLMMSGTIIITPDVPAFLFWALGIFFAWQIFSRNKAFYWYLLGIVFGLSLLSKYTSVLLAPCIFLYMLFTEDRRWFKTIHPYLAFLTGLILFLPVVIWNMDNSWISFRFQAGHGLKGYDSFGGVLEYLGGQLLVLSPFAWLLGIWATGAFSFSKTREKLFTGLTSFPVILIFALTSFKHAAAPNWPALAYFSFTPALCAYFLNGAKWKKILFNFAFIFSFLLSSLAALHAGLSIIPLEKINGEWARTDATNWFYGWKELAARIRRYPDVKFIITPSHTLSATLEYYLSGKAEVYADNNIGRFSQYNLWKTPFRPGAEAMYVSLEGEALDAYKRYFSEPVTQEFVEVHRGKTPIKKFRIIYGKTK